MTAAMEGAYACIRRGGIAVIPTDTILGIVAAACDRSAVARLYALRRKGKKPFIILIPSYAALFEFGVRVSGRERQFLKAVWPGRVSVILPCPSRRFSYLHRGANTLAFRIPRPAFLRRLLRKTGPLVAPSANPEGMPPARTVSQARRYFGERVGCYVSSPRPPRGEVSSTIVSLAGGAAKIIRAGGAARAVSRALAVCEKSRTLYYKGRKKPARNFAAEK